MHTVVTQPTIASAWRSVWGFEPISRVKASPRNLADTGENRPRPASYASRAIVERRTRILVAARKLVAAKGMADLSMEEVSELSQVSKRTLYNIFKSRDALFAAAIQQYFADFESRISYKTAAGTAERIVEHLSTVCRRNLAVREYTGTLLTTFFSAEVTSGLRDAIFEIAAHSHRPWIEALASAGELLPYVEADQLIADLVRYRYAVGVDWACGRLDDRQFAGTVILGVLTLVRGACQPPMARQIEGVMSNWKAYVPDGSLPL